MTTAIETVQEGQWISQAARDHGVPKTTLYDLIRPRYASRCLHSIWNHKYDSICFNKFLNPPLVSNPPRRKRELRHARLLTSGTAFDMLKEKEKKKQEEAEMKEKKRKEREEMKKRKKQEQSKKAEERVRKQE